MKVFKYNQRMTGVLGVLLLWVSWGVSAPATVMSMRPATTPSDPGVSIALGASAPLVNVNGSNVLFLSTGNNVVPDDNDLPFVDLFWRDLSTGDARLVSVRWNGTGGGNGHSGSPSASSNGMWVAFSSEADDLIASDTNQAADIFLRDLSGGGTTLITVPWNGLGQASGMPVTDNGALSDHPILSWDGRRVAFETRATNLTSLPDLNGTIDVVMRDLNTASNHLISVNLAGTGTANGMNRLAGMSPDGERVWFTSTAVDLVTGSIQGRSEVYVREIASGETRWLSADASGFGSDADFIDAAVSREGNVTAFKGRVGGARMELVLLMYDDRSGEGKHVAVNVSDKFPVSFDASGRFLAYSDDVNVFVWDTNGQTNIFMTDYGIPAGDSSPVAIAPVLTPDGRYLAFLSSGTDLVGDAIPGIFQAYMYDLITDTTTLVSRGEDGDVNRGAMEAFPVSPLPDGSGILFESADASLVEGDFNRASDIFLHDMVLDSTRLISRRSDQKPATTSAALVQWTRRALSDAGDRLVFATMDNVWSADDTNVYQNIALTDLQGARTWPVVTIRVPNDPGQHQLNPIISATGSHLAYDSILIPGGTRDVYLVDATLLEAGVLEPRLVSAGTSLAPSDRSILADISSDGSMVMFESRVNPGFFIFGYPFKNGWSIFLRHTQTTPNVIKVVDVRLDGTAGGNGSSTNAWFTPDDQWVVFGSQSTDLTTNVTMAPHTQLFARHLASESTRLVSYQNDGTGLNENAEVATSSGDSRFVVFHTNPEFQGYRHDLQANDPVPTPNDLVCTNCSGLTANENGTLVSYLTRPEPSRPAQIYVRDMSSGQDTLVSVDVTGAGEGDGDSHSARVSPNGRFVLFASRATNLVPLDGNGTDDVFLRDLQADTTILLSRSIHHGGSGNNISTEPIFSGNGRTVAFRSFANDLVPGDYNLTADLFALNLGTGDSDEDELDDAWEVTFFGDLTRDGTGDFDMDGQSDRAEHDAGTDPTNAGSIFQVLTMERMGSGPVVLIWSSIPGKHYQVEYKEDLNVDEWTALGNEVFSAQTTASAIDDTNDTASKRFYRVRLVP